MLASSVPDPHVFGIRIRIHQSDVWIRIRILLSSSKKRKKNRDSYYFGLLSLKNDVNVPSKSNKQKDFFLTSFFVGILKVNDENIRIQIRIRIRIRIYQSGAWIRGSRSGSGSTPKCHGPGTLLARKVRKEAHQTISKSIVYFSHCSSSMTLPFRCFYNSAFCNETMLALSIFLPVSVLAFGFLLFSLSVLHATLSKKVIGFPVPSWDVTYQTLPGRESQLGTGKPLIYSLLTVSYLIKSYLFPWQKGPKRTHCF